MSKFKVGHPKFGGLKKGTSNKSKDIIDNILHFASKRDLDADLTKLIELYPTKYWDILVKICQKQSETEKDAQEPIVFHIRGFSDRKKELE